MAALCGAVALAQPADPPSTTVRITSPLGRTGVPGVIRVVAQVQTQVEGGVLPVRFFVDGAPIGADDDGPPYAVEWTDENPYEAREIRVDAEPAPGVVVSDTVKLPPLEILEETSVSSVLVEATVQDKDGRYISWLEKGDFSITEDGVRRSLDLVQLQDIPTTFTLLIDSSQSLNRRMEMVKAAAKRLASELRKGDRVIVAPFRTAVESTTGPTDDGPTIAEAIAAIRSRGGTAILDALTTLPEMFSAVEGRHVVILLTDGYDENSSTTYDDAIRALQRLQATVYVVGIGGVAGISLKGETLLRRIATQMGGRAFFPNREDQLPNVHATVAADAFRRYLLSYTPKNQEADGTFRTIGLDHRHSRVPDPHPRGLLRAQAAAGEADDRIRRRSTRRAAPRICRPTTWSSSKTASSQKVESFQEAVAPMAIALVMDTSGSMRRAMDTAKQAARSFVTALRPADPLALVRFSDRVVFEHELSDRRQTTLDAIDRLEANGGTALFDALYDSMSYLKKREGRRAIVLLSDGRDENNPGTAPGSVHTVADALAHGARDRYDGLRHRARRQRRSCRRWNSWRCARAARRPSRPTPASSRPSSRASSTSCGGATSSATPRPTRSATAAGGRSWSEPASPGSPSGVRAATSPRSRPGRHRGTDEDRRTQRVLDGDRTGDRRGAGGDLHHGRPGRHDPAGRAVRQRGLGRDRPHLPALDGQRRFSSSRNSIRVRASSWKTPSIALVVVVDACFSTPRIAMHRCVPSQTTATPSGVTASRMVSAI